jgi:hypothetical protein
VDRFLRFRIVASFGPGESRVFTLPDNVVWDGASVLTLTNQFDPDRPGSLFFDVFNLTPSPPAGATLRHIGSVDQNSTLSSPVVRLSVNGTLVRETMKFGELNNTSLNSRMQGQNYVAAPAANKTPAPQLVDIWRPIYPTAEFDQNIKKPTNLTSSSAHAFGRVWLQPFSKDSPASAQLEDNTERYAALSKFNLGARYSDDHPQIDNKRNLNPSNNADQLPKMQRHRSEVNQTVTWDEGQSDASGLGFSLITFNGTAPNFRGLSSLPIRNARRAGSEVLSIGQFQQANLAPYFWQPTFPIGNSEASPYVDREAMAGIHSRTVGFKNTLTPNRSRVSNDVGNTMVDLSYLLNDALWDRYFLSTIPQSGAFDPNEPLPNARLRFRTDEEVTAANARNFSTSAAMLYNVGALNVNSTSVEAWKALLTAFRDLALESQAGQRNAEDTVPVVRTLKPIANPVRFLSDASTPADYGAQPSGQRDYSRVMGGFRFLDDDQIQRLAERIVDEVRFRGPFLGLADFVNRRLVAPSGSNDSSSVWYKARTEGQTVPGQPAATVNAVQDYMAVSYDPLPGLTGLNGALQRAINLSGINGGVNYPALPTPMTQDWIYGLKTKDIGTDNGVASTAANYSDTAQYIANDPAQRHHLDTEHLAGAPVGESGQLFLGTPGFVTQGDVLSMIGSAITPRGDTFLVRSYGEAINPSTGKRDSRAWLEAIVQRVPDPVTPKGTSGIDAWTPNDPFGRKFKILSIRWLNPEDV